MINEVFPNPTVVNVIFQIRFPNLFYLENRIGDYQLRIMERFPESKLLQQRNVVVARLSADGKVENLPEEVKPGEVIKLWQFLSKTGVQLNVTSDSLSLSSEKHKTYKNSADSDERFRDAIEFAVNNFLAIMPFSLITRIGLRYVDNCPLLPPPTKHTRNTTTPLCLYRGLPYRTHSYLNVWLKCGGKALHHIPRVVSEPINAAPTDV